jgi:hypothetical protein
MPVVDVYNLDKKKVGTLELADAIFAVPSSRAPLPRGGPRTARGSPFQGTREDQGPIRGHRFDEEDLQAEGHR